MLPTASAGCSGALVKKPFLGAEVVELDPAPEAPLQEGDREVHCAVAQRDLQVRTQAPDRRCQAAPLGGGPVDLVVDLLGKRLGLALGDDPREGEGLVHCPSMLPAEHEDLARQAALFLTIASAAASSGTGVPMRWS